LPIEGMHGLHGVGGEDFEPGEGASRRGGVTWLGGDEIEREHEDGNAHQERRTPWQPIPELAWPHAPETRQHSSEHTPSAKSKTAQMECVNNWLHDLSQMIEPNSP
jgi:hypothetical protein